jgi:hypothetical protein
MFMHPDYEKYRTGNKGRAMPIVTSRMPEEMKTVLELIANLEDDSLSGLILEGAARVIEERSDIGLKRLSAGVEQQQVREQQLLEALARYKDETFGQQVD